MSFANSLAHAAGSEIILQEGSINSADCDFFRQFSVRKARLQLQDSAMNPKAEFHAQWMTAALASIPNDYN